MTPLKSWPALLDETAADVEPAPPGKPRRPRVRVRWEESPWFASRERRKSAEAYRRRHAANEAVIAELRGHVTTSPPPTPADDYFDRFPTT